MKKAELTRRNTKGDIVIPARLAKTFGKDAYVVVLKDANRLIVEEVTDLEQLKEDLEFARRTREAWKRYEGGEFRHLPLDEFLQELKRW